MPGSVDASAGSDSAEHHEHFREGQIKDTVHTVCVPFATYIERLMEGMRVARALLYVCRHIRHV